MRKLILLVPDRCLAFYFSRIQLLRTLLIARTEGKNWPLRGFYCVSSLLPVFLVHIICYVPIKN